MSTCAFIGCLALLSLASHFSPMAITSPAGFFAVATAGASLGALAHRGAGR